jgi:hypothetical protein
MLGINRAALPKLIGQHQTTATLKFAFSVIASGGELTTPSSKFSKICCAQPASQQYVKNTGHLPRS